MIFCSLSCILDCLYKYVAIYIYRIFSIKRPSQIKASLVYRPGAFLIINKYKPGLVYKPGQFEVKRSTRGSWLFLRLAMSTKRRACYTVSFKLKAIEVAEKKSKQGGKLSASYKIIWPLDLIAIAELTLATYFPF